ncbi:DUF1572 family protein [Chitinophaga caeni]|nr:DUF1572 family protein [Chitinophaga caeni]
MMDAKIYVDSMCRRMAAQKVLAEKTIAQLSDEQLLWQPGAGSNSIFILMKHIAGNMVSRFTDFLDTDGEKTWRNRDEEFSSKDFQGRKQLLEVWDRAWQCFFNTLHDLEDKDFSRTVFVKQEAHTAIDAINRQVVHYADHVGQIVYIGKMLQKEQWQSLSIPRKV